MNIEANAERRTPNTERRMAESVRELFERYVVPSYGRFDIVLERGEGSYVWDSDGRRYLDFGAGIAVCAVGHANKEVASALHDQALKLTHISNLYYNELQGRLAERLVGLIGPGRCFFCNSGAEANEGLFKLARKFGHADGRYEIITAFGSFHGRTLAGISATGQEKVKQGFEPMVSGFKHVPFNDLESISEAITPQTAAILVEPVQGESGITVATREYLIGLRKLCDEHNLLLLFDEVQAGHFRTGKFHSWQAIVESVAGRLDDEDHRPAADAIFLPDAISMAKALGGGFPMGAFWVRDRYADVLSPGTHASTFGGTPLACAVALKVLDVIKRDSLADNADTIGQYLVAELRALQTRFPQLIRAVRGLGLMIGIEFVADPPFFATSDKPAAIQVVSHLHQNGLLTVPAAPAVVRLLPPLNISRAEAADAVTIIVKTIESLNR
ncbi:MAG TPA: aspartate aminotransferase family protein [Chthoniobacterales bacterium]|jgi:acetylornithine aminotransferase/acetylornithine/N-succinyldiaminopimelate aminotransferase